MTKPTSLECEKSLGQHSHRGSPPNKDATTPRRIIFPSLHPKSGQATRYYGSQTQHEQQQQHRQQRGISSEHDAKEFDVQDIIHRSPAGPEMERSLSFPKNGLKGDLIERNQILPLPKLPELKPNLSSSLNPKPRGLRIRDSICVRKSILPTVPLDEHQSIPSLSKKWVVHSPQVDSLSLETQSANNMGSRRTYYPAASIPKYHEPPTKAIANTNQHLQSILRTNSAESLGKPKRRSSIVFRKSSTVPLSPDDVKLSPNEHLTSSLTLASPTSIRSLASDLDHGEIHHESIGETESDLNRITVPPQKVIPRQDAKLRRNASDTVVVKSEEEVQQRRKKSNHNIEDKKVSTDEGVTRHESLECLPSHKKISFDPHIWVYEFTDDRHEFENGGKWFTEDELDQFKEDAIQRIRQRNMKMMSAGQGRIAMVPPQPIPIPPANSRPVVFTHPALGLEDEFDSDPSFRCTKKSRETLINDALSREMRNVLVVDPHDVFLTLFTKCFKYIIPHVSVATARSGEEALSRIQAAQKAFPVTDGGAVHGFDIIVVEEHLVPSTTNLSDREAAQPAGDELTQRHHRLTSGSSLIKSIVQEECDIRGRVESIGNAHESSVRFSLVIGVSAYLAQDEDKLKQSGADFVFGKPPPEMNSNLRNDMLKALMKKRNIDCSLLDWESNNT